MEPERSPRREPRRVPDPAVPGPAADRRGAALPGFLVLVLVVVLLLVVIVGGYAISRNNVLVSLDERVDAGWSEVSNQYQRRYDLVPSLVETVKGAANFEKSTLTEVTEARASVGKVQLPDQAPTAAQLEEWSRAQGALGSALGRLLVVAEQYPELKASQSFLALQDQLEGTENRIAVARNDYIDAVREYNTQIRSFPTSVIAGLRGFEEHPQLQVESEVTERPPVDFDFGE